MILSFGAGCSTDREYEDLFAPGDLDVLVVDAALIVGDPLPLITLTRTQAPDQPFDFEEAAELGAVVTVTMIGVDGSETVFPYGVLDPGRYVQLYASDLVLPETEYRLRVETTRGEVLTARTTTPAQVVVDSWVLLDPSGSTELRTLRTFEELGNDVYDAPENQITYAEGLLEAQIPLGGPDMFGGLGYQLALFSIDPGSDYVIDPPFFEEEDFEDLQRQGSSPPLSGEDGGLRLPWFAIYYEGRHLYKIYVLDRNWYDLARSDPDDQGALGFGGNTGDAFTRPIFNVNGGIGLFGSASVSAVGFRIHPQEP